jgi:hypothetical protein
MLVHSAQKVDTWYARMARANVLSTHSGTEMFVKINGTYMRTAPIIIGVAAIRLDFSVHFPIPALVSDATRSYFERIGNKYQCLSKSHLACISLTRKYVFNRIHAQLMC